MIFREWSIGYLFFLYKFVLLFYSLNLLFSLKYALYVLDVVLKIQMFPICLKCWTEVKTLPEKIQLKTKQFSMPMNSVWQLLRIQLFAKGINFEHWKNFENKKKIKLAQLFSLEKPMNHFLKVESNLDEGHGSGKMMISLLKENEI